MGSPVSAFTQITIPSQKQFNGVPFPLALAPPPSAERTQTKKLVDMVLENKHWLEERLNEAGALLFRGFDVRTPIDFNAVLEAFGYKEAPVFANGAHRTHIVGRVYTANDGPPSKKFHFHNEMAYIEKHPTRAFFYCEEEPESGGETPIVLTNVLYQKMLDKYPEFVRDVERCSLVYSRGLANGHDPTSMIGRGWQDTFNTEEREVAENKAAELGWKLHWREDGGVDAKMTPVPGVKIVQGPDGLPQKLWFNSLAAAYFTWREGRNGETVKGVQLSDGTEVPKEIMEDYLSIAEDESVAFPWRHGDVLLLDNLRVQHSRNPFIGARRVLAAFTV